MLRTFIWDILGVIKEEQQYSVVLFRISSLGSDLGFGWRVSQAVYGIRAWIVHCIGGAWHWF